MSTCRDAILDAMLALKVLTPGDDPQADELATGLTAISVMVLEAHNARGPMLDVDISANYVASENQRVRIQAGVTVTVTLPNSVPIYISYNPNDYGFSAPTVQPPVGSIVTADGAQFRQPHDGARIEIVGTTQALYFYRADINQWQAATELTLDAELPFNARYTGAFAALLAERLMDVLAAAEPSPGLTRRIQRGNSAMLMRTGTARDPVIASYL